MKLFRCRPRRSLPWRKALSFCALALCLAGFTGWKILRINPRAVAAGLGQEKIVEYPAGILPKGLVFERLEVDKAKRLMTAYAGGQVVRVYQVALGENPVGHKQFEGDRKTPEGLYAINGKNPNSSYYKNLGISYPNARDRATAKALGKAPGGDIKIHGLAPQFASLGAAHRASDWTWGCIAVTNEEMEELYTRVPVGIPIQINP